MELHAMRSIDRFTFAAATAVAIVLSGCNRPAADAKEDHAPNEVRVGAENVAVVVSETLATGPAVSGTLTAEREATLRAQMSGAVLAVHVDQGSHVQAGTLLASLDDRTQRDAFLSARSGLTTAQNTAERAKRDLERAE